MRKTYDVNDLYVYIRFTDLTENINSRKAVREAWKSFDVFVTKEVKFLTRLGYQIRNSYKNPWFCGGIGNGNQALQQWNGTPIVFPNQTELDAFISVLR